jgi:hypothetical protein
MDELLCQAFFTQVTALDSPPTAINRITECSSCTPSHAGSQINISLVGYSKKPEASSVGDVVGLIQEAIV